MAIEVKVKTLWNGRVAIRNKYVDQALRRGEALVITCDNLSMAIPPKLIQQKIVGKKEGVKDNFSDELHTLYYFKWEVGVKPDVKLKQEIEKAQAKLL